jgi:outer membrane protein
VTVRKPLRQALLFQFVTLACCLASTSRADDIDTGSTNGFTILNNATNVTHWGLGAGVAMRAMPYKGDGTKVLPVPLASFDNKWIRFFGNTLDVKVGQWNGLSVALRGQVTLFDGYKQSDAPILNGMKDRNTITFWYGPALSWRSTLGTLSGSYLVGGNKGQRASVDFTKNFDAGKWSFSPHLGAEWLSDKYVDYYYGVSSAEAHPWRPQYSGTSTLKTSVGARVDYRLTAQQTIGLDVAVAHLGSGISDSPLAGRRFLPEVRLGYMYRFK